MQMVEDFDRKSPDRVHCYRRKKSVAPLLRQGHEDAK